MLFNKNLPTSCHKTFLSGRLFHGLLVWPLVCTFNRGLDIKATNVGRYPGKSTIILLLKVNMKMNVPCLFPFYFITVSNLSLGVFVKINQPCAYFSLAKKLRQYCICVGVIFLKRFQCKMSCFIQGWSENLIHTMVPFTWFSMISAVLMLLTVLTVLTLYR